MFSALVGINNDLYCHNVPRSEVSSEAMDRQRIQDMNRAYRAKKERIDCLWDRHVETKNKKIVGDVV